MIRFITHFIFLMGLLLSQEATAFIKYFNNDRDFLGDKPMLASERNTVKHIRVLIMRLNSQSLRNGSIHRVNPTSEKYFLMTRKVNY